MSEAEAFLLAHSMAEAFLFAFVIPFGAMVTTAVVVGMYLDLRQR
jgi:hypothetical protein